MEKSQNIESQKDIKLESAVSDFYFNLTIEDLKSLGKYSNYQNMTYNSILYLDLITYSKDCTVTSLAKLLGVSKAAVTLKVNELLKLGYIQKKQSQTDKRVFYLSPTDAIATEYDCFDEKIEMCIKHVSATHTAEEIDTFCKILNTFTKKYREV